MAVALLRVMLSPDRAGLVPLTIDTAGAVPRRRARSRRRAAQGVPAGRHGTWCCWCMNEEEVG